MQEDKKAKGNWRNTTDGVVAIGGEIESERARGWEKKNESHLQRFAFAIIFLTAIFSLSLPQVEW